MVEQSQIRSILSTVRSVAQGQRLLSAPMVDKLVSEYTKLAREMEKQGTGMDEDEIEILKQLALGATNAEIASKTSWSLVSIKRKLQVIFDKLGVDDRTSAAVEAVRRGLI